MNVAEVMKELEKKGSAKTRETYARHGASGPCFGVKVSDLKILVKKIKRNTPLAKELFATGNHDAMYLAGLIGYGAELTRDELQGWAERATGHWIFAYTVPWMAVERPDAWQIGLEWIDSPVDKISTAGWHTLANVALNREDKDLDLKALEKLLDRVVKNIGRAPNYTRQSMNGFVISVGSAVKPLTKKALEAAARLGKVEVDMGDTACEVPDAAAYIRKIMAGGRHGKKRATVKC